MDGTVTIAAMLDTKEFDSQIKHIENRMLDIEEQLKKADMGFEVGDVEKLEVEYERLGNQLIDLKKRQEQYNASMREMSKAGLINIQNQLGSIGRSIEGVTKKVVRWGLAIFGVRSAYLAIRSALSIISAQDEQLAADIQYIRTALAYTLEPIVRAIVDLAKQLMIYIGYIIKALTGKNIFENANKGLKNATGSAKQLNKELQKTTASFDEMNVLSESSSGGAGGGATMPSFDLTKIGDMKIPWLDKILKYKDEILAVLAGVAAALVAIKLGFKGIKALGIGIAIAGLVYTIEKIIDFINDPSFENFIGILEGIAIAVGGVALAFGAWPVAIGAAIALVVIEIVKHFDEIENLFNGLIEWLDTNVLGGLRKLFGPVADIIYMPFKLAIDTIKILFESFYGGVKKIIDGIVKIVKGDLVGGIKLVLSGFADILLAPFKTLWNTVKTVFTNILNFIIDTINSLIDAVNVIPFVDIGKIPRIGEKKSGGGFSGGGSRAKGGIFYPSKLPKLAVGGIINNPGPGVPYNGAYIGERGAEAVVPLTDSQQMELLGATIGRYITINANITTEMNGRVISKELQRINAENDFAYNR